MKTFISPFVIETPPLASAALVYGAYMGADGTFPLTVVNNPDGTSSLSTTADMPKGVHKLLVALADTKCCPRCMLVWVEGCPPTTAKGTHNGGSPLDTGPVPSCDPA